jgi:5-methylcytosine-specific restriction enzyme subunit McrC
MNALFENFLIGFIRRHRSGILPEELQPCRFLPQTRGATLFLAHRERSQVFQLKPDLSFQDENRNFPLLLDAKYKSLNERDLRVGISQSDFYQMHAYAHRYECRRVILIYPQTSEIQNNLRVRFRLQKHDDHQNHDVHIDAATIDLRLKLSKPAERKELITELKKIFAWSIN